MALQCVHVYNALKLTLFPGRPGGPGSPLGACQKKKKKNHIKPLKECSLCSESNHICAKVYDEE